MMRAAYIESKGMDSLIVRDFPLPAAPGPNEVVVRVSVASLVWRDLAEAKHASKPFIPGSDACGHVIAVGSGVTRVAIGDRVCPIFAPSWIDGEADPAAYVRTALGQPGADGVLREQMTMSEEVVLKVPDYLTDAEAACLPCAAVTAWRALMVECKLQPGQIVCVQGTGGVSLFVLQLAVAAGCKVIVTEIMPEKLARAQALAGSAWLGGINVKETPSWGKIAKKLAVDPAGINHGCHCMIDVVGGNGLNESIKAMRNTGNLACVGVLDGLQADVNLFRVFQGRLHIHGVSAGSRKDFENMVEFFTAHQLRPVVDATFPLEAIHDAFTHLTQGGHTGKVCVNVTKAESKL
jgi:NADPH:quinone reductase-like Zn-dependent oxidoreductase